jgi:alkyldihydroxyacetonephosphate synthase
VIQRDLRPAIVRLYDAEEAAPHLAGTGSRDGSVLLLWGMEGPRDLVELEEAGVRQQCEPHAALDLGSEPGERWWGHRLSTAALLETLNKPASVSDALEVTGSWSAIAQIYRDMKSAMQAEVGNDGRVYGHLSHVYHTGANLYMIFHATADRAEDVPTLYDRVLDAAFTACLNLGGSLSHHHGVGSVKARWLPDEHGPEGIEILREMQRVLDPAGIMNPASGFHGGAR